MSFIAFLGCDGSGKSSVIGGLAEHLKVHGEEVSLGHWAPRRNGTSASDSAEDPHGKPPRGQIISAAKLGYLGFKWWRGWWGGLRTQSRRGVLLFDRYHADLLVDPRRYRYGGPRWLATLASNWMPQPDIVFFLDAPPEVLMSRKQEVSHEALETSRRAYLKLASQNCRLKVIDASRPVNEVIADVLRQIHLLQKRD
jgi:thymidylate kinase